MAGGFGFQDYGVKPPTQQAQGQQTPMMGEMLGSQIMGAMPQQQPTAEMEDDEHSPTSTALAVESAIKRFMSGKGSGQPRAQANDTQLAALGVPAVERDLDRVGR